MTLQIQPHLRLGEKEKADYALLPGDPGRVGRVKDFLDHAREIACCREYRTLCGYYKGVRVLVTSTGIGGASTAIAVEELGRIGVRHLIRTGSCGALQKGIKTGELIIAAAAVRDEGASAAYVKQSYPAVPDARVFGALKKAAGRLNRKHHCGIVRSHDSFYTDEEKELSDYWAGKGILGSDMETATLFVVGGLRKIKTGSILNVVVGPGEGTEAGVGDYASESDRLMEGERAGIRAALEAIVELSTSRAPGQL